MLVTLQASASTPATRARPSSITALFASASGCERPANATLPEMAASTTCAVGAAVVVTVVVAVTSQAKTSSESRMPLSVSTSAALTISVKASSSMSLGTSSITN